LAVQQICSQQAAQEDAIVTSCFGPHRINNIREENKNTLMQEMALDEELLAATNDNGSDGCDEETQDDSATVNPHHHHHLRCHHLRHRPQSPQ
jgi:hypothetical protein